MLTQLQVIVAVTEQSAAPGSQNDPMHGVTLKALLSWLVEHYGWQELGQRIPINCFLKDPSINSSLKFLRKTPWARAKVEALYIKAQQQAKSIWNAPFP